jgi:hypothetical protein
MEGCISRHSFLKLMALNQQVMKEVYYKGQPYEYKVTELEGKRHFQLFENGRLKHSVEQGELDIRSIVSFILDSYYRNTEKTINSKSTELTEV